MKTREWKDTDQDVHYFFNASDGRIVGQVHNISHTKVWIAKVIFNYNEEKYIGQFINVDYSKKAIEQYWMIEDRTLLE